MQSTLAFSFLYKMEAVARSMALDSVKGDRVRLARSEAVDGASKCGFIEQLTEDDTERSSSASNFRGKVWGAFPLIQRSRPCTVYSKSFRLDRDIHNDVMRYLKYRSECGEGAEAETCPIHRPPGTLFSATARPINLQSLILKAERNSITSIA